MPDSLQLELIHAEIDGELDGAQRAELARLLLADPGFRTLRDELRSLCRTLDATETVEPPPDMHAAIRHALSQLTPQPTAAWRLMPAWKYAAFVASLLIGGALLLEAGPWRGLAPADVAGTMAPTPAAIDSVVLRTGPVTGRVSLFRNGPQLGLELDLAASVPVDVRVTSPGHTLQVSGLGGPDISAGQRTRLDLPGPVGDWQVVNLSFLSGGREVAAATLKVSKDR